MYSSPILLQQVAPPCVTLPYSHHHLHNAAFVASGIAHRAASRRRLLYNSRGFFTSPIAMATGDEFSGRTWRDGEAHEILPRLFLGSMEAALDKESLQANGVTHILTVNGKEPKFEADFEYKVINFGGENGGLTQYVDDSLKFVETGLESGGVLIHCTHGTGRSAAMTIAAVMKANGEGKTGGLGSFTDAFQLVKARRPGTDPPLVFQKELADLESS